MARRRYVPPDSDRVAARFGIEPASEEAGKRAFMVARELGVANSIATWDRTEYQDGAWKCVNPGLTDDQKRRWRLIAAAAGAF